MSKLTFTCPDCGHHVIEEIMSNAHVTTNLTIIDEDGDHDYGEPVITDSFTDWYQCANCAFVIKGDDGEPIKDCDVLGEWVEKHQEEENDIAEAITFTCKKCGGHTVEEIGINATVSSLITRIDTDGEHAYGDVEIDDQEILRYQCRCGEAIKDEDGDEITDSIHLADSIKGSKI